MVLAQNNHSVRDKKFAPSNCLTSLLILKVRKAFILAWLNVLFSILLEGRYCSVTYEENICLWASREVEIVEQLLDMSLCITLLIVMLDMFSLPQFSKKLPSRSDHQMNCTFTFSSWTMSLGWWIKWPVFVQLL